MQKAHSPAWHYWEFGRWGQLGGLRSLVCAPEGPFGILAHPLFLLGLLHLDVHGFAPAHTLAPLSCLNTVPEQEPIKHGLEPK